MRWGGVTSRGGLHQSKLSLMILTASVEGTMVTGMADKSMQAILL